LAYKIALTDSPFGQETPKYSDEKIEAFTAQHEKIMKKIYEFKILLYT
jgi:hypothetical protein